eukprot:GFYU01026239.1.p1 GENE.GFYU01026239.1~~GFYU01026239.1.p1  ORF type:complete len:254 (-),score=80.43 GFYU01026239.1:249-962(-)
MFWISRDTLLGCVRTGKVIPWETESEFALMDTSVKALKENLAELRNETVILQQAVQLKVFIDESGIYAGPVSINFAGPYLWYEKEFISHHQWEKSVEGPGEEQRQTFDVRHVKSTTRVTGCMWYGEFVLPGPEKPVAYLEKMFEPGVVNHIVFPDGEYSYSDQKKYDDETSRRDQALNSMAAKPSTKTASGREMSKAEMAEMRGLMKKALGRIVPGGDKTASREARSAAAVALSALE